MLAIKTVASQALFGTSDAARFLGISKDTLFRMTHANEIPAYRFRHRVAYKLEDLEGILNSLQRYNADPGEAPCVKGSTHGH